MTNDANEREVVFDTVSLLPQEQTELSGLKYKVGRWGNRFLIDRWKTT
ncbi:MAG: hypothetical protein WCH04_22225 [Gammaproteobacteria bacterium]